MKFISTEIDGVFLVELEPRIDDRGYFTRQFAQEEFDAKGIKFKMVQTNQAFTKAKGVLRGMHWQTEPKLESKFFQCLDGEIFDVICDTRPDSPTYGKWQGFNLTGAEFKLLFIPGGIAHGYETLTDNCKVQYMVSEFYAPETEKGFRWNDPTFNIKWPMEPTFMSDKDKNLPDYTK
ncbi:MAG TPA: dTDP-4-dehydrorhamnose 3,5-epimerase [Patescibacteria group bacterium]|nr:dTDP-4-dehydrorhamnose 3,5-epimerase [Patescibacteria group bacterium]